MHHQRQKNHMRTRMDGEEGEARTRGPADNDRHRAMEHEDDQPSTLDPRFVIHAMPRIILLLAAVALLQLAPIVVAATPQLVATSSSWFTAGRPATIDVSLIGVVGGAPIIIAAMLFRDPTSTDALATATATIDPLLGSSTGPFQLDCNRSTVTIFRPIFRLTSQPGLVVVFHFSFASSRLFDLSLVSSSHRPPLSHDSTLSYRCRVHACFKATSHSVVLVRHRRHTVVHSFVTPKSRSLLNACHHVSQRRKLWSMSLDSRSVF
jgi:hypothetical protein